MKSKHVGKQILSALLVLCLILSTFPATVLAAEPEPSADATALLQETRGRFFCLGKT